MEPSGWGLANYITKNVIEMFAIYPFENGFKI